MRVKMYNKKGETWVHIWRGGHLKSYPLAAVLEQTKRNAEWLELRGELTRKRDWERTHLRSRDLPGSRESRLEISDRGRGVEAMIDKIDGPRPKPKMSEEERNRAIIEAAVYVAHTLGYKQGSGGYAEVLSIISAVALYGRDAREKVMEMLGLNYSAYLKRLARYTRILNKRTKKQGGV